MRSSNVEAEAPEAVDLWRKRKRLKYAASASGLFQSCCLNFGRFLLTRKTFLQFLLNIHLNSSKFFSFIENNVVKYYLTNYKTNLEIEKQNQKQIWKRKRLLRFLLEAEAPEAVRMEAEALKN
jgi:hypothetical protein